MSSTPQKTEISFQSGDGKSLGAVHLDGSHELAKSPEKIRQVMELLNLPAGTHATITTTVTSTMVR